MIKIIIVQYLNQFNWMLLGISTFLKVGNNFAAIYSKSLP